jgi:hypothetical protein
MGDYLARVDARQQQSSRVSIAVRSSAYDDGYLDDPTYKRLVLMTERSTEDDAATRFADYESQTFLLVDSSGRTPGAYRHDLAALSQTFDRTRLREAMGATLPASGSAMRILRQACSRTMAAARLAQWEPRSAMLMNCHPVDIQQLDGAKYDNTVGLLMLKGGNND